MADAMVTARMLPEKKEAGNRVLEQLGTNASQAINELFDYVIDHRALPFEKKKQQGFAHLSKEELAEAIEFVNSMRMPANNRFATMTDDEIKMERLQAKGYFDGWGGY